MIVKPRHASQARKFSEKTRNTPYSHLTLKNQFQNGAVNGSNLIKKRSYHVSDNVLGESDGTVKWFNNQKGFGFIEPDGGGPDAFAHFSAIEMEGFKTLKEGERVKFALEKGPKGLLALRIRTARSSNPEVEAEAA